MRAEVLEPFVVLRVKSSEPSVANMIPLGEIAMSLMKATPVEPSEGETARVVRVQPIALSKRR